MNSSAAKRFLAALGRPLMRSRAVTKLRHRKELKNLADLARVECQPDRLLRRSAVSLDEVFHSAEIRSLWREARPEIDRLAIPDGTGGVNPGDRQAVFFLISKFKPGSVLEIGTHIGASTVNVASALQRVRVRNGEPASLTSVDVLDVNSEQHKPWLKFGMHESPRGMIADLGYESFVQFVTDTSMRFAANCGRTFDFIFLDGDHSATAVYQEISVALKLLNKDGVILLHDYFPDLNPLWSNGSVIPGPFAATQRHLKEGADLAVLPLGELPWPTKLSSRVTSLALLLRKG